MLDENKLVSKSRAILEMKNSGYNTGEFKILDTYLSRINPLDPSTSRVKFSKSEYCKLMGIDSGKIRTAQLKKYTSHFLGNVVTIPRSDGRPGYEQNVLFTKAEYDELDEEIVLQCNPDPTVFNTFFNIDNIGYVKYILKNTINFKSLYSFKLYMLLKSKLPASEFQIDLATLKDKLEITAKRYESFKFLNSEILKVATAEVNEKTDTYVEYEKITKRRLTVAVKFKFGFKQKASEDEEQLPGVLPSNQEEEECEEKSIFHTALPKEFTDEEVEVLRQIASDQVPYRDYGAVPYECVVADYMRKKTALMNAQKNPVENKFAWLRKAISEDFT